MGPAARDRHSLSQTERRVSRECRKQASDPVALEGSEQFYDAKPLSGVYFGGFFFKAPGPPASEPAALVSLRHEGLVAPEPTRAPCLLDAVRA